MSESKSRVFLTKIPSQARFQRQSSSKNKNRRRNTDYEKKDFKEDKQTRNQVCYISSKKSLQSIGDRTDRLMMFSVGCDSPRINALQDIHKNTSRGQTNEKGFRSCRSSFLQTNHDLKISQDENELILMKKKLKSCEQKQNRLEQQNKFCLDKMQELSFLLSQKDEEIANLNKKLIQLLALQKEKQEEIQQLSQAIRGFNSTLEKASILPVQCEQTSDDWGEKMELENQLQRYRNSYEELSEKVKYIHLIERMHKKTIDDFEKQLQITNKFKAVNRRLVNKILTLQQEVCYLKKNQALPYYNSYHENSLSISLTSDRQ